jgi:DNA-directed RNA polymerase, mitochondrial
VLPDDLEARQKLLEDSVYEDAIERLKHQAEVFDKLGLGDGSLKGSHLQRWMWDWHQKLQKRLKSEISDVIAKEVYARESFVADSAHMTLIRIHLISG